MLLCGYLKLERNVNFIPVQEYENTENASPLKAAHKKEKRKNQQGKDKPPTVSLKEFQLEPNVGMFVTIFGCYPALYFYSVL